MRRDDNLDIDGGDSDGDDDEEVVYTAGESTGARNNQVKIELEPNGGYNHHGSRTSRSRGAAYQPASSSSRSSFFANGGFKHTNNNNNNSNDYELKRFGNDDDDEYSQETGCVRVYKFFLLNLSFFIYVSFGYFL